MSGQEQAQLRRRWYAKQERRWQHQHLREVIDPGLARMLRHLGRYLRTLHHRPQIFWRWQAGQALPPANARGLRSWGRPR